MNELNVYTFTGLLHTMLLFLIMKFEESFEVSCKMIRIQDNVQAFARK